MRNDRKNEYGKKLTLLKTPRMRSYGVLKRAYQAKNTVNTGVDVKTRAPLVTMTSDQYPGDASIQNVMSSPPAEKNKAHNVILNLGVWQIIALLYVVFTR